MTTTVKCRCGHRIASRDILRTDVYVRTVAPNFIWIKYRCCRCKQIGETFVPEEQFDNSILRKDKRELSDNERDKFAELSAISADDLLDFRSSLNGIERIQRSIFGAPEKTE